MEKRGEIFLVEMNHIYYRHSELDSEPRKSGIPDQVRDDKIIV